MNQSVQELPFLEKNSEFTYYLTYRDKQTAKALKVDFPNHELACYVKFQVKIKLE